MKRNGWDRSTISVVDEYGRHSSMKGAGSASVRKPRVVQVITRLNVGGPARHGILIAKELEGRGFRSGMIYGSHTAREGFLAPDGVDHVHIPALKREVNPAADARAGLVLLRQFRAGRPDLVHTHTTKAGVLGRVAARRAGVAITVHTFHGHVLEEYFNPVVSKTIGLVERKLARRTDALVAVSPAVRDSLLGIGVGIESQWHVLPLALELDDLLAGPREQTEARRALDLPPTGPIVGIVGRLVSVKDHATFLNAAARIVHDRPDVTFLIAGDGDLRDRLHTEARERLGERVRFTGWVLDLSTLYGALDVVVLTSRNEGTPVALIEAGAAGLPVVATRVGGVPDVVTDQVTGYLVPAGDSSGLAQRITSLIDDSAKAQAMGAAARNRIRERFSTKRAADATSALYRELLGKVGRTK